MALDATTGQVTSAYALGNSSIIGGGVWATGSPPLTIDDHTFFVTTANSALQQFDVGPGTTTPQDLSESLVRFDITAGVLNATSYFRPCDAYTLNLVDEDMASTSALALDPTLFSTFYQQLNPSLQNCAYMVRGLEPCLLSPPPPPSSRATC